MPGGTAAAEAGISGRSMLRPLPPPPPLPAAAAAAWRVTTSSPLSVSKASAGAGLPSPKNRAAAAASVAWPHRGTSIAGVNQRSAKCVQATKSSLPSAHSRNAVSERLNSAATCWRVASDSGKAAVSSTTAAGLPAKGSAVNASICRVGASGGHGLLLGNRATAAPFYNC